MHPETVPVCGWSLAARSPRPSPPVPSQAADVLVQQQVHAGVDGEVAGQLKLVFARRSVEKDARSWAVPRDSCEETLVHSRRCDQVEVVHWESHVKFFAWRGDGANS